MNEISTKTDTEPTAVQSTNTSAGGFLNIIAAAAADPNFDLALWQAAVDRCSKQIKELEALLRERRVKSPEPQRKILDAALSVSYIDFHEADHAIEAAADDRAGRCHASDDGAFQCCL